MTILIAIATLLIIAGAANAVMDTLAHHYSTSVFAKRKELFWNPAESWRNKYKNGDPEQGAKFFLSTTLFVFVTDSWHLFKFFQLNAYTLAVTLAIYGAFPVRSWWMVAPIFIAAKIAQSVPFNLLYGVALKQKTDRTT